MEKVEIGSIVKHTEYNLSGKVVEFRPYDSEQVVIEITHGEHPFEPRNDVYVAHVSNLVVVEPEDAFEKILTDLFGSIESLLIDEAEPEVETSQGTNVKSNGKVVTELPDGTKLEFEHYSDFMQFMEDTNAFNK